MFIPTWGNDPIWRAYFLIGLVQPPTRYTLMDDSCPSVFSYIMILTSKQVKAHSKSLLSCYGLCVQFAKSLTPSYRDCNMIHQSGWIIWFRVGWITLSGTHISHQKSCLKMMFLFPRWDMLIPWRVYIYNTHRPQLTLFNLLVNGNFDTSRPTQCDEKNTIGPLT